MRCSKLLQLSGDAAYLSRGSATKRTPASKIGKRNGWMMLLQRPQKCGTRACDLHRATRSSRDDERKGIQMQAQNISVRSARARGSAARSRAYRQRRSMYLEPLSRDVDAAIAEALAFVMHAQSIGEHRVSVIFSMPLHNPRLILFKAINILQAREGFDHRASVKAVRARLGLRDAWLDGAHTPAFEPSAERYPPKLRGIAADALDRLARLTLPGTRRPLGHEEAERRIRAADLDAARAHADEHGTLLVDALIEHCLALKI